MSLHSYRQKAKNMGDSYSCVIAQYISDHGRWPLSQQECDADFGDMTLSQLMNIRYFPPTDKSDGSFILLECSESQPPYQMTLGQFKLYNGSTIAKIGAQPDAPADSQRGL